MQEGGSLVPPQHRSLTCSVLSPACRSAPSLAGPSLWLAFWTPASLRPQRHGRKSSWARFTDVLPSPVTEDQGSRWPCLQHPSSLLPSLTQCVWEEGWWWLRSGMVGTRPCSYLFPHVLDKLTLPRVVVSLACRTPRPESGGKYSRDTGDPSWEDCCRFSVRE